MIDRILVVRRACDVLLERKDQPSFDALVGHLNDLFEASVTLAEADEIFETDYSNATCFWERVRNAKNAGAVPLMVMVMVMRKFNSHGETSGFEVTRSREFREFCGNHLGIVFSWRDDEYELH